MVAARSIPRWCAGALALVAAGSRAAAQAPAASLPPVVATHCAECHRGPDAERDFDVTALFTAGAADAADFDRRLELAVRRVRARTMPPPDEVEPPADGDRHALLAALTGQAPPRPGTRVSTIRRLTRRQYERSVEVLFGVPWHAHDLLPDDASAHGFDGVGDVQNVAPLLFEKYLDAAASVAAAVLADPAARRRALGDGASPTALARALPDLLRRAWRRPVGAAEIDELLADHAALRASGVAEDDANDALLRTVLVAPSFLFRAEVGQQDAPWQLTAHELAVRLSFLLTSAPPDDRLRAAADDGSLLRREVLVAEALRLARADDGRGLAEDFAVQWLDLSAVLTATADFRRFREIWNHALRPAMRDEVVHAFAYLVRADRSVLELLDADYAFVDATLAQHYGLPSVEGGGFRRVPLPDRRRGGVLGAGAMLMATSYPLRTSPVKRGQWILQRLLDAPPPPPPPDAGTLPADDRNDAGLTLRQQLERHRRAPRCASCHAEMDVLGFALEHYDPLGRWRDEVHGQPVDAAAELPDGVRIDGPAALKDALLRRGDDFVRAVAKNLLVFGTGRDMLLRDEPELAAIVARTRAGGDRFLVLLEAVVTSPLFTMRDPDRTP
ncbi:MAG: DUF1588 domain-containing protein [Planctomycetota bacterium]